MWIISPREQRKSADGLVPEQVGVRIVQLRVLGSPAQHSTSRNRERRLRAERVREVVSDEREHLPIILNIHRA